MGALSKQMYGHNFTPRYSKAKPIQRLDAKIRSPSFVNLIWTTLTNEVEMLCFKVKNKISMLMDVIILYKGFVCICHTDRHQITEKTVILCKWI